jgi:TonB family protein
MIDAQPTLTLQSSPAPATRAAEPGPNEGLVMLVCRVMADGHLTACVVKSEKPPGRDFGNTALKLSKDFKMAPRTKYGQSVAGGIVTLPIRFKAPPAIPSDEAGTGSAPIAPPPSPTVP